MGSDRDEAWLLTSDFNDLPDNTEKVGDQAITYLGEEPDTIISSNLSWLIVPSLSDSQLDVVNICGFKVLIIDW